jgi:hypothetical protein
MCKLEKPKKVTHFKPNNSLKKELLQTNQNHHESYLSFIFSIFALIAAFHSNYPEPNKKQRHVYFIFNIVITTIHT